APRHRPERGRPALAPGAEPVSPQRRRSLRAPRPGHPPRALFQRARPPALARLLRRRPGRLRAAEPAARLRRLAARAPRLVRQALSEEPAERLLPRALRRPRRRPRRGLPGIRPWGQLLRRDQLQPALRRRAAACAYAAGPRLPQRRRSR